MDTERDIARYRVCENCGFRLMRSERILHQGAVQEYALCRVCRRQVEGKVVYAGDMLTRHERRQAWVSWLYSLGLSPEDLDRVYHLQMVDFFEVREQLSRGDAPIIK